MKKLRKNTMPVLVDLKYSHHRNRFEEFFGEGVSYTKIEQDSYIALKDMVFEMISRDIKFRKFCRDKVDGSLTIKVDMLPSEYDKFLEIVENTKKYKRGQTDLDRFEFITEFMVSGISIMTKNDIERNKKTKLSVDEYKFIETLEEEIIDEEDEENVESEEEDEF